MSSLKVRELIIVKVALNVACVGIYALSCNLST